MIFEKIKKLKTIQLAFIGLGILFFIPGSYFFFKIWSASITEISFYMVAMIICFLPAMILWNIGLAIDEEPDD